MSDQRMKLFTWRQWVIIVPAIVVGASLSLIREYRNTGAVQLRSVIISLVVLCVGLGIAGVMAWYGNRPESKETR